MIDAGETRGAGPRPAAPGAAPRRVRVAVAASGLGHVARGNESWAEDLGGVLARRGEAVVLCKGGGQVEAEHERRVGCWRREGGAAGRMARALPRALAWRVGCESTYSVEQMTFALNLIPLLRRERADILHVQDPLIALAVQRARALGLVRARAVLAHGTEESADFLGKIRYLQHLAPWYLEQARAEGLWKPTWTAIPNFVDAAAYRPGRADPLRDELGIPRDGLVVLCVAAIRRAHKRIDHLVAEFARLRAAAPELPAWLVVAGGWDGETDGLIAEGRAALGDRVRFLVRFPRRRMAELYRAADLFVLGSLYEMFGIVLLEAAASGLPSLVHRHPVLGWVVGPGGRSIAMDEPGRLAAALRDLLADPAARRDLGRRAREHAVAEFGSERVADQILDYYGRILGRGPAGGAS